MRLLIINPNSTESMTRKIEKTATEYARSGTELTVVNPQGTPVSIEGFFDEALSVPGAIDMVRSYPDADAVIVACFDDTGLDALRCMVSSPVIGIGEAAFHVASLIANKFSVITTLSRSVPAIEHNLVRYGFSAKCVSVRASEVPVLDLESDSGNARQCIAEEVYEAIKVDRAEAIVLGCAGMTDLTASLESEFGLPVLDGVACAVSLSECVVQLGCKTSKIGGYAFPRAKSS